MLVGNADGRCRRCAVLNLSGSGWVQRLVGLFDGPASGIEEVAVEDNAHDKCGNDPFTQKRVF